MRNETSGTNEYRYNPQAVPAELLFLSGGVPDCSFPIFDPEADFSNGQQAGLPTLEYANSETQHELLICKRLGEGRGLTTDEAGLQLKEWRQYGRTLVAAGWITPELYDAQVEPSEDGHVIKARETYVLGEDGERMLRNPHRFHYFKAGITNMVVHRLYSYPPHWLERGTLGGDTVTLLPHGVDLKPSNVIIDEDTGRFILLDTFAPKLLGDDGSWASYSPKLEHHSPESMKRLCATREGCLLRYWRSAEQLWLAAEQERTTEYRLTADDLRDSFLGYIRMQCEAQGITLDELSFIGQQIEAGYPWLDGVATT